MENKIERLLGRLSQVEQQLLDPSIFSDQKIYKSLTQEHAHLSEVKKFSEELLKVVNALQENRELLKTENDVDFTQMLREEIAILDKSVPLLEQRLEELLVPPDPTDSRNTIVEIRAGTGGDEASIFVGDVVRMYQFFANKMGWRCEMLSASPSELGGYKEAVMVLAGLDVYRFMKYEGGTHRVQRVPRTETQGRVHTAVRITHIPTGVACYCQEERSQHKNKDKAMRLLKAKLVEEERRKKEAAISSQRSAQVGSGDRSERIRTYNFPQNRLTDHRIDLTLYNLSAIMEGELLTVSKALVAYFHQLRLQD